MKTLRRWGFFLYVQVVYLTHRRLPFKVRVLSTRLQAFIVYHWLWKEGRERIRRNICLIRPDLGEKEIAKGSWQVAKTIARSWAAMLGNEFTSLKEVARKLEVEGIETLLNYYLQDKKIIATAVHVGPIDEMFGIIPLFGLRTYIPVETINPRWYFNLMMRLRLCFGDIVFEEAEKGKILDRAPHHLSDGRIVVLLVDALRRDSSGVMCRIGGAKARFPVGAVKLALEQGAIIIPAFPSFGGSREVKVVIGQPFELLKTGNMNQDIEMNTRRLIEEVYAPHIRENYHAWLRLLWDNLEPAGRSLHEYQI